MKIQKVRLNHFKRFQKEKVLDFTEEASGLARDLVLPIGKNGSGKSSVLQAIAAVLGEAAGRLEKAADLDWPGFNGDLLGGTAEPHEEELEIEFSRDEIEAARENVRILNEDGRNLEPPGGDLYAKLAWRDGRRVSAENRAQFFQFKGRSYARQLVRSKGFSVFENAGSVFWYQENRTATTLTIEDDRGGSEQKKMEFTYDMLRDKLSKWQNFHQRIKEGTVQIKRAGQKDMFAEIENLYKTIFMLHRFIGTVPNDNPEKILDEPWFFLSDGKNNYEISEMSEGERAILPILVDFDAHLDLKHLKSLIENM